MRIVDLAALELFLAVITEGGVLRAAEKLGRVPSNVTTRVRQLEERLGVALFRRQGRGLVPTAEGQLLRGYAERLLRLAEETEAALQSGKPVGTFRIGSLESTAGSRLPPILSAYNQRHPQVRVELVTGTTGALLRRVAAHELEAAFVSEPFHAPGLRSEVVFTEELVLISGKASPALVRPADLRQSTLIAFASGCSYRRRFEEWLGKSGGAGPATVLEFASYPAIIACVAAGTGVAMVPRSVLQALRASSQVRLHELPPSVRKNQTHLVAHPGAGSMALQALRGVLRSS